MVQRPLESESRSPDASDTARHRPEESRPAGRSAPPDPVNAAREIPDLVDEIRDYFAYYTAARKDIASAKLRSGLGKGALIGLGGMAGFSAIAVSVGLLFTGLAQGLGHLFGGRFWLGYAVLGATVLILAGLAAWLALRRWKKTSRENTIRKYEDKKQVQQLRFRHNVCELQEQNGRHKS